MTTYDNEIVSGTYNNMGQNTAYIIKPDGTIIRIL